MTTVQRLRLKGINTPETNRKAERQAGLASKAFVEDFVYSYAYVDEESGDHARVAVPLWVKTHKTGKFGRWIADIYNDDNVDSLNQLLVENGLAEVVDYD